MKLKYTYELFIASKFEKKVLLGNQYNLWETLEESQFNHIEDSGGDLMFIIYEIDDIRTSRRLSVIYTRTILSQQTNICSNNVR